MIQEKFGVGISVSAVGKLLKKNGIWRLKCGSLPAKADAVEQQRFYDTVLRPYSSGKNIFIIAHNSFRMSEPLRHYHCKIRFDE